MGEGTDEAYNRQMKGCRCGGAAGGLGGGRGGCGGSELLGHLLCGNRSGWAMCSNGYWSGCRAWLCVHGRSLQTACRTAHTRRMTNDLFN